MTCIIAHSDLGDLLTKRQQLKQRSVWQMDPGLMGARILIVDDEEIVIKSWLRILGGGDYQIDTAYDGREALRKIEENHYDVMILDVVMPNMGGLEVLRRVKKTHPDMDVIMVTGLALVHTVVQARRLGARDFISKPFEPDELKLVVQRALERQ